MPVTVASTVVTLLGDSIAMTWALPTTASVRIAACSVWLVPPVTATVCPLLPAKVAAPEKSWRYADPPFAGGILSGTRPGRPAVTPIVLHAAGTAAVIAGWLKPAFRTCEGFALTDSNPIEPEAKALSVRTTLAVVPPAAAWAVQVSDVPAAARRSR